MQKKKLSTGDISNILKERGFKVTPGRVAVLSVFMENHKPMDANFVFNKINKKFNEVTVYRIISCFEKCGLLRKVDLRKESVFFEINEDHHHHMVCMKCGLVEEFEEGSDIEKILKKVVSGSREFKNIKEHSLELFGYCKTCN
jgi:Fe2+ or Zn2+ uptake regulation protein